MSRRDVVLVIWPPAEVGSSRPREFFRVDPFAEAVGRTLGRSVSIVEGTLADVGDAGAILYFNGGAELSATPSEVVERVVWMLVGRQTRELYDRYPVPATVSLMHYLSLTHRGKEDLTGRVWVRSSFAERIEGAEIEYQGMPGIVRIVHPRYPSLPSLIAAVCATVMGEPLPRVDGDALR